MAKPQWIVHLETRARQRRFALISALIPATRPLRILDVGGRWDYWQALDWRVLMPCEITLFNLEVPSDVPQPFTAATGDARDLSRYADDSFDLVYSNSVIGHVGTFADQQRMASEIRRVGKAFILQTPNHHFLIDWRTLVPCFHWLPAAVQAWCFAHMRVGTYPKAATPEVAWTWATRIRNLTRRELRTLFPDSAILRERVAGFTKSFIVHGEPYHRCNCVETPNRTEGSADWPRQTPRHPTSVGGKV